MSMRVGVLALQGAVAEHVAALVACGVDVVAVKRVQHLEGLRGLVIPGGESTTVSKLMATYGLDEAIVGAVERGMGLFGTCTGLILMAKEVDGQDQAGLQLVDIAVRRNAYGRQVDSFEECLDIPVLGPEPFRAVFIRAPYISRLWGDAKELAAEHGHVVLAQQGRMLVAAFHPELTEDLRIHRYFLTMLD